ncbi:MAG: diaminopimelate dehydrogenase [Oscillospiraceae bacterium]|nr:diaminopimelate dehydrogenase [Oscillospiraceae bacterium]
MSKIRIGIVGYGNLGKGVELAIRSNPDTELAFVATRRDPSAVTLKTANVPVYQYNDLAAHQNDADVVIVCGGSATDLPTQTPELAKLFTVVDSFDTHARIPEHFANVDAAAKASNHVAMISVGWDPGMFSLARLYGNCILPEGKDYTFWGKGVSQGHSDAIRRVEGVQDGKQYTVPIESAMEAVRRGEQPELTTRQKHLRECYVVAKPGADLKKIEHDIKTMPNYFDEYDTVVHFISQEELNRDHAGIPHGGFVMRSGVSGENKEYKHLIEYSLKLDSNPEFTTNVLVAFARAAARFAKEQSYGCKTVFDVPPAYLSPLPGEELRAHLL